MGADLLRQGWRNTEKLHGSRLFWVLDLGMSAGWGAYWQSLWGTTVLQSTIAGLIFGIVVVLLVWAYGTISVLIKRLPRMVLIGASVGALLGASVGGAVGGAIAWAIDSAQKKEMALVEQVSASKALADQKLAETDALRKRLVAMDRLRIVRDALSGFQTNGWGYLANLRGNDWAEKYSAVSIASRVQKKTTQAEAEAGLQAGQILPQEKRLEIQVAAWVDLLNEIRPTLQNDAQIGRD